MANIESRALSILKMHEGVFGQHLEKNQDMEQFTWLVGDWLSNAIIHEMGEFGATLRDELQRLLSVSLLANEAAHVAETAQYDRQAFGEAKILEAKAMEGTFRRNEKSANVKAQQLSERVTVVWGEVKQIALQILESFAHQLFLMEEEAKKTATAHQELVALDDEGHQEIVSFKNENNTLFKAKEEQQENKILRFKDAKKTVAARLALLHEDDDMYEIFAHQDTNPKALDSRLAIPMAA